MYTIVLCDDEPAELDKVEKILSIYYEKEQNARYQIRKFRSTYELLYNFRKKEYVPDLLLLDIYMPVMTGVELAEELRRDGCDVPVIFITASKEHALDAYGIDAIQYLVKPFEKERFFHAMDIAWKRTCVKQEEEIIIKLVSGIHKLHPDDIIYCETQRNYQILFQKSDEYKVRMSSGELYGMLCKFQQFEKCGRSYILNMNHIIHINKEEIHMDNGNKVYIPRNRAAEFSKIYFDYYFRECGQGRPDNSNNAAL